MQDENGHYLITGRVDDVVNIKGHKIGTAEIECAMVNTRAVNIGGPTVDSQELKNIAASSLKY